MRIALVVAATGLVAACGGSSSSNSGNPNPDVISIPVDAGCNPLGVSHCLVPWPNSAFEVADATSATGRRLAIPDGSLPKNSDGLTADPTPWNLADGFSPAAPMLMAFPGGISADGLPSQDMMDFSTGMDSPTVLLDMTTGERVAHFAEIDMQASDTPDSQALFIRPSARLVGGHRYAVAITNKVKAADGSDLAIPPGFAALRDNKLTDNTLLEAMRPRYADVLSALDTAGFDAGDLVVAWDFTVASDAFIHGDMIAVRDRTIAALQTHTIAFTFMDDVPPSDIHRTIEGTLDAPLFLTNGGAAANGTVIARDDDGLPAVQGFYQIPFHAIVPDCAYTSATPVPMIIYGHGLLGDSGEATGGVQRTTANELCMVIVGTDMRGMSGIDLPAVVGALNDISKSDEVFEKLEQGIANHITLVQAMRTTMAQSLFVDAANNNRVLVDPTKVYYYGLSQGAIFGTSVMAYEPTMTRAVLGVGGANYSTLLERSADWPEYRTVLAGAYTDSLDITLDVGLFQMRWDKTEGSGVVNSVLAGDETGTPPKQLLMQIALGDEQVPNLGSYWEARSLGIPVIGPTPAQPWGLSVTASPIATGSALLIMDGGAPPVPESNLPAPDHGMHDLTRDQPAARRMMGHFFATGEIVNECDGVCECVTGNDSCN
ncbi:MAG TPA: hypothetical protein VGM88_07610 [Kofleriaceae bacterium]|jgi:hypothetical protein